MSFFYVNLGNSIIRTKKLKQFHHFSYLIYFVIIFNIKRRTGKVLENIVFGALTEQREFYIYYLLNKPVFKISFSSHICIIRIIKVNKYFRGFCADLVIQYLCPLELAILSIGDLLFSTLTKKYIKLLKSINGICYIK